MRRLSATICLAAVLVITAGAARADLAFNNNPAPLPPETVYVGGGGAIPDNTPGGANFVITVPDSYTIATLSITLTLTHSWAGDIIATLTHGATTIDLMRRIGSSTVAGTGDSSNFGAAYVFIDSAGTRLIDAADPIGNTVIIPGGNYRATSNTFNGNGTPTFTGEVLVNINAAFAGANVNGNWTLNLSDNAGLDTGSLTSWSIDVQAVPEPTSFALLGVAVAGALGVRAWRKRK